MSFSLFGVDRAENNEAHAVLGTSRGIEAGGGGSSGGVAGSAVVETRTSKTFVVTFTNTAGFDQFGVRHRLINWALDGGSACYTANSHPAKAPFPVNGAGPDAGLSAARPLGSTGQVSNGQ